MGILETKGPNFTTYFILAAAAMVRTSTYPMVVPVVASGATPAAPRIGPGGSQTPLPRFEDSNARTLEPLLIYNHEFQFELSSRTLTRSLYINITTPYAGTTHLPNV